MATKPEMVFFGIGREVSMRFPMECISRKTKFELFDAILRDCPEAMDYITNVCTTDGGKMLYLILDTWAQEEGK